MKVTPRICRKYFSSICQSLSHSCLSFILNNSVASLTLFALSFYPPITHSCFLSHLPFFPSLLLPLFYKCIFDCLFLLPFFSVINHSSSYSCSSFFCFFSYSVFLSFPPFPFSLCLLFHSPTLRTLVHQFL